MFLSKKLANLYSLKSNVFFVSMHPGWVDTEGVKTSMPSFHRHYEKDLRTLVQGSDTAVWLLSQPRDKLINGGFYFDREYVL